MKLTSRSEYALLALIYLSRQRSSEFIPVESIAAAQQIPGKYLEQILLTLKRARYLLSAKGQKGGFKLARPANTISLAEVIRLFDGALAPTESVSKYFYEPTPIEREQGLIKIFKEIRDQISDKLETTTVDDIK